MRVHGDTTPSITLGERQSGTHRTACPGSASCTHSEALGPAAQGDDLVLCTTGSKWRVSWTAPGGGRGVAQLLIALWKSVLL